MNRLPEFLSTTALEEFWDSSRPTVFLGEWCRLYERKHIWDRQDNAIVPDPYADNLLQAYQFTIEIYEKVLFNLSEWLNKAHGTSYSTRYWRIFIGPYLLWYIQTLYDRFLYLQKAYSIYPHLETIGLCKTSYRTPINIRDFVSLASTSHGWNLQLFTQLLDLSFKNPLQYKPYKWEEEDNLRNEMLRLYRPNKKPNKLKQFLFKTIAKIRSKQSIAIHFNSFSLWDHLYILLKSNGTIFPITPEHYLEQVDLKNAPINGSLRETLEDIPTDDSFCKLVLSTLKTNMPMRYLELYANEKKHVEKCYPYTPRMIVSSLDYLYTDQFKLWAAKKGENQKTALINISHASYGLTKFVSHEYLEYSNCDYLISWGISENNKIFGCSSPFLSKYLLTFNKKRRKELTLYISSSVNAYLYSYDNVIAPPAKFFSYLELQKKFLKSLNKECYKQIILRQSPTQSPWRQTIRLTEEFPDLKIYDNGDEIRFIDHLLKAKLVILDYFGSTSLYSIGLNIPTIIFWDKNCPYLSPKYKATECFQFLKEAGVFHTCPESAARMANDVYNDPDSWWLSEKVQKAKELFCKSFNRYNSNYKDDLVKTLKKIYSIHIQK